MPPFVIPSFVKVAAGALGAGVIAHWVMKEVRRINEELDRTKTAPMVDPGAREELPTLRRDPRTGDWRVI
jgi:hypothetical protein